MTAHGPALARRLARAAAAVLAVGLALLPAAPAAAQARNPGDGFRDCAARCPEMVVVPAGRFVMGSPQDEDGRSEDEGPAHAVTIAAPFAVGRLEVTRGEYAAFIAASGYAPATGCQVLLPSGFRDAPTRTFRDPGFEQDDRHPAVCVSWDDAKAYLAWLSQKAGFAYRLLSEAEWEYAARAGTAGAYPFDPYEFCARANGADLTFEGAFQGWIGADCEDGHVYTAGGGSLAGNAFGLHDMLGNVWEWTADCYHEDYTGAPADGTAWMAGECRTHVARGGSFDDPPAYLRPAFRDGNAPDVRYSALGFRVARSLRAGE